MNLLTKVKANYFVFNLNSFQENCMWGLLNDTIVVEKRRRNNSEKSRVLKITFFQQKNLKKRA